VTQDSSSKSFIPVEASQPFFLAVEKTIRRYSMLTPGDTVLVGVSGGPDSVALLHVLAAIAEQWSIRLVAAYLNHNLRREATEEADFVTDLSAKLSIPCEVGSENVAHYRSLHRTSMQQAARQVRYRFYNETAAKYAAQKIALGHHLEDNVESVLIHFLRGAGPLGLSGIPPVRDGRFIRPLIDMTRHDILSFLAQNRIPYLTDASNRNRKYLRNRIRHDLIPALKAKYNPNIVRQLHHFSTILREEESFWEMTVSTAFQDLTVTKGNDWIGIDLEGLRQLHPAVCRRIIRRGVAAIKGDLNRIGFKHIKAVEGLIIGLSPSRSFDLPGRICVMREPKTLLFYSHRPGKISPYRYIVDGIRDEVYIREVDAVLKLSLCQLYEASATKAGPCCVFADFATIRFPLIVRNFLPGDRFRPLGMSGTQKVKDFFMNKKVPIRVRRLCPMILSEETIIWVGGYRLSDLVKMTSQTRKVLKLELLGCDLFE
jgi:tRNA(Ile)-lysidine synthase